MTTFTRPNIDHDQFFARTRSAYEAVLWGTRKALSHFINSPIGPHSVASAEAIINREIGTSLAAGHIVASGSYVRGRELIVNLSAYTQIGNDVLFMVMRSR